MLYAYWYWCCLWLRTRHTAARVDGGVHLDVGHRARMKRGEEAKHRSTQGCRCTIGRQSINDCGSLWLTSQSSCIGCRGSWMVSESLLVVGARGHCAVRICVVSCTKHKTKINDGCEQ